MNWTQEERSLYSSSTSGRGWAHDIEPRVDSPSSLRSTYNNNGPAPSWSHEAEEERLQTLRTRNSMAHGNLNNCEEDTQQPPSWSYEAEEERLQALRREKGKINNVSSSSDDQPPSWSHEAEEERLEQIRKNKSRSDYTSASSWSNDVDGYEISENRAGGLSRPPPGQEECPFCFRLFPLTSIEKHVEQCMKLQEETSSSSSSYTAYAVDSPRSQRNDYAFGSSSSSSYYSGGGGGYRNDEFDQDQISEDERLARQLEEEERRKLTSMRPSSSRSSSYSSISSSSSQHAMVPYPPPYATPPPTYISPYPRYSAPMYMDHRYVRYPRSYAAVPKIKYEENKRFILKQKGWVFGGEMYIKDPEDEELFRVKGRLISLGTHITICDLKRNSLIDIKQSLLMPKMPQFHVYQGENICLLVKKKNKSRNDPESWSVDSVGDGTRLRIVGEWKMMEYEIHRGTGAHAYPIATIARRQWRLLDSYSVEVAAGEDVLVILALCIIVDKIVHENW
eukprot:TRINITY_DN835_c0_g1_i1.p1 TRINITY_DN835_c0_g1~~TRINITY_DN835_c0_g1_i1.p1  ORF type:complete len:506 (-),score=110.22 TRINITY_DN835_c0_g1_i1:114-1631(-)